jgi:hypothetical protein
MSTAEKNQLRGWSRRAGLAGGAALFLGLALAGFAPAAAWPAYRLAAFACLQPALGCLIFQLIHRLTGGQWGDALAPFLAAGIRMLPWIWPFIAILLFFPAARATPVLLAPVAFTPSAAGLLLRAGIYELFFLGFRRVALRTAGKGAAGASLILVVFIGHFLAADWFFTLEPGWYSSGFPLVWLSIAATAGLALAIAFATACGLSPATKGAAGRPLGQDWGDLLLTSVIFSSYLAFVQFLIIWAGNLPAEISWYVRRSSGGWQAVAIALGLFHLAFPTGFMLFRRYKHSRSGVPRVARLLCGVELLWMIWFIVPAFPQRGPLFPVLALLAVAAGAGIFFNRYAAALLRAEVKP